jgi:hypothetical protein
MRYLLAFITAAAASPLFAQQELPDRFFLECKSWQDVLVLVDRKTSIFYFKKPRIQEMPFTDTPDALINNDGSLPDIFSKWDGSFQTGMNTYRDCQILDPDSRQPLFK